MLFSVAGKTINDKCTGVCETVDRSKIVNEAGKNKQQIVCRRCQSLIFPQNVVVIVKKPTKVIKNMSVGALTGVGSESIKEWWYTESDLDFDTVGWQTVDGVKALVCGDCEFGPFGFRTDDNKKFYVAVERVKYI
uniref:Mss4-like protein n=1 Tax=Panagrolaimus sp. ES5 TaxID=591445 RepID=A0AC34GNW5_9BILA